MQQENPPVIRGRKTVVRSVKRSKSALKKPVSRSGTKTILRPSSKKSARPTRRASKPKTTVKKNEAPQKESAENTSEDNNNNEEQHKIEETEKKEGTDVQENDIPNMSEVIPNTLKSSDNQKPLLSQTEEKNTMPQLEEQAKKIHLKESPVDEMQLIEEHYEEMEVNCEDMNCREVRINLKRCMYSVVESVASDLGMVVVREDDEYWDIYWSDYSLTTLKAKYMNIHQRINHFPGMANLESKAFLAFHLNRMKTPFEQDYNFFPKSWSLPYQRKECLTYLENNPKEVYILKPSRGAEGKGIKIFNDVKELPNNNYEASCQKYIIDSLLLDGFKFDLRVYVLVTSIDPLQIFVYNNGLVRLATCPYNPPNEENMSNQYMHLTNYSINKSSKDYDFTEEGSKRDFEAFGKWLQGKDLDPAKHWRDIDDIIIKTIISVHPILKDKYEENFPLHYRSENSNACFEILGFDIILDQAMKPYLLEVNRAPSFNITGVVDEKVKKNLIYDTFKLLDLHTKSVDGEIIYNELGNYRQIFPQPPERVFDYSKFMQFIYSQSEHTKEDLRRKKTTAVTVT